jgi:Tol biopolymer transport system component
MRELDPKGEIGCRLIAAPSTTAALRICSIVLIAASACTQSGPATTTGPQQKASPSATGDPARATAEDKEDLAGRKLAFVLDSRLYTANGDGSHRDLIARVPHSYAGPYWSPEAKAFVLRGEQDVGNGKPHGSVYRVDIDGTVTNLSAKAGRTSDGMVGWSPDGEQIVFTSRPADEQFPQIYVMYADGTNVTKLTSGDMEAQYPAWSPDGRQIAFTGIVHGFNFEIFVMDADGSNVTNITEEPTSENWAAWSGDGTRIAFSRQDEIWAMDADGSNQQLVTTREEASGGEPNWSADGEWITFDCSTKAPVICAIHPDGTGFTRLFAHAAFPFWMD